MLKVIELFGGIGACTQALKRIGIDFKVVDYVEIDKYAVASYNAMNNTNFETQDICEWDKDIEADLIMHGSPCQDFSIAGKQAGGDEDSGTRSSLMYETIRIVNKLKPKYVIWENVKNLLSKKHKHNFDKYIEILNEGGYNSYYQVLNAKDYGIPQNRERVFTISIRKDIDNESFTFPEKQKLKLKLRDMLEDEVDEKYYLSDKNMIYAFDMKDVALKSGRNINERKVNENIAKTISCRGATEQRADVTNFIIENFDNEIKVRNLKEQLGIATTVATSDFYNPSYAVKENIEQLEHEEMLEDDIEILENEISYRNGTKDSNLRIRKLTPKECWRLMGFKDEEFEKAEKVNSNAQLYKQAGNSIVVDVLEKIFRNLLEGE